MIQLDFFKLRNILVLGVLDYGFFDALLPWGFLFVVITGGIAGRYLRLRFFE